MKPKTDIQKEVVELSQQIPPVTQKQMNWAYENCLQNYFLPMRDKIYCLECGHDWKDQKASFEVCPNCDKKLELNVNGKLRESAYFGILTTIANYQVFRVLLATKHMKKRNSSVCETNEVMQHWVNENGVVTSLVKNTNTMSMYYDAWVNSSKMEVRTPTRRNQMLCDINPLKIYPVRKIQPIVKRNGFNGHFYNIIPQKLISAILTSPQSETLLKTGQYRVLRYFSENPSQSYDSRTWTALKTCIRNNYIVNDMETWNDYIQLLVFFNRDLHNPKFVCPTDLKRSHDKMVEKKRKFQLKQTLEQRKKQIAEDQRQYTKDKKQFFGLVFSEKAITIRVIEQVADFMEEGDVHNHCVYTNEYYKKEDSLILSASMGEKRLETIQVSLETFNVLQSRGKGNKATKYHNEILNLVNNNMKQIELLTKPKKRKQKLLNAVA